MARQRYVLKHRGKIQDGIGYRSFLSIAGQWTATDCNDDDNKKMDRNGTTAESFR